MKIKTKSQKIKVMQKININKNDESKKRDEAQKDKAYAKAEDVKKVAIGVLKLNFGSYREDLDF